MSKLIPTIPTGLSTLDNWQPSSDGSGNALPQLNGAPASTQPAGTNVSDLHAPANSGIAHLGTAPSHNTFGDASSANNPNC